MTANMPPPPESEGRQDRAGEHRFESNAMADPEDRQGLVDDDPTPLRAAPVLLGAEVDPADPGGWWVARAAAMTKEAFAQRHHSTSTGCPVCGLPSLNGAHSPCLAAVAS